MVTGRRSEEGSSNVLDNVAHYQILSFLKSMIAYYMIGYNAVYSDSNLLYEREKLVIFSYLWITKTRSLVCVGAKNTNW